MTQGTEKINVKTKNSKRYTKNIIEQQETNISRATQLFLHCIWFHLFSFFRINIKSTHYATV